MLMIQFPSWMETSKESGAPFLWKHRASWHLDTAQRALVCLGCELVCVCVCVEEAKREGEEGESARDNMMFTLGLFFWERASIQPCCDTHHTSNLAPFIITLYSQRPHLVCYYQRSSSFPSMYVRNPTETNMSNVDNCYFC